MAFDDRGGSGASETAIERMRLECGATAAGLMAERVHDARQGLIEAMKIADRHRDADPHASDLHRRTCALVSDLDDFLAYVADRSVS
jgi:hypothetical protein